MQDHPKEFIAFRNFLFKQIDKIKDKRLGSETFATDLQNVRREIDDQLHKLGSDLKRSQLKHYVEMTGGVTAAFVLSLFCFVQHDPHTLALVGPGGFLFVLSSKLSDYLSARLTLKDSPVYILWMIGSSKRL